VTFGNAEKSKKYPLQIAHTHIFLPHLTHRLHAVFQFRRDWIHPLVRSASQYLIEVVAGHCRNSAENGSGVGQIRGDPHRLLVAIALLLIPAGIESLSQSLMRAVPEFLADVLAE